MSEPTPNYPPYSYENREKLVQLAEANQCSWVTCSYNLESKLVVADVGPAGLHTFMHDVREPLSPLAMHAGHANSNGKSNGNGRKRRRPKPHWDADNFLLTFCGVLSKRVEPHAYRQIALLNRFQWVGWEPLVKRPIPDEDGKVYAEILHEAVRGLNHAHVRQLIEFHQDGSGQGARWNPTAAGAALLEREYQLQAA